MRRRTIKIEQLIKHQFLPGNFKKEPAAGMVWPLAWIFTELDVGSKYTPTP